MQSLRQSLLAILCLLAAAVPATAAQFIVNNTADVVDATPGDGVCETVLGNGVCTLRAAIQEANALLPAPVGGHTITLPAGTYTLTIPHDGSVPDDASGDLTINNDLTINGAGAATTIIEAGPPVPPSTRFDGVISVHSLTGFPPTSNLRVRISDVTIQNGDPRRHAGGGISNSAILDLINVVVTGNRALEGGAGIANVGTLTLTGSIVSGNTTSEVGLGGGIFNLHPQFVPGTDVGVVTITDSTISGNTADSGGGIENIGGVVTITNSTISGNTTNIGINERLGGGIRNQGDPAISVGVVTITNSTISGNTADEGGGIENNNSVLTITNSTISGNTADEGGGISSVSGAQMKNTIIAGNSAPSGPDCFTGGSLIDSLGHNLVGNVANDCLIEPPGATGDQIGTPESPVDPHLGTLADNGGPTLTHALLAGSPAINAGDSVGCPPTDQRGVHQGAACDIGAFEFIPLAATFATSAGQFSNLSAVPENIVPAAGKPAGLTFPFGFFSWTVSGLPPGQMINVTITYPTALPVGAQYWKVTGGTWIDVTSLLGTSNANGDNTLVLTIVDGGLGDSDGLVNGEISDPGGVGIVPTSTVPFGVFIPEVEIKLPRGVNNDTFEVEAFFTLGGGSDGIAPLAEALTLEVGPYSTTIPAGSFKQKRGRFRFEGVIAGVRVAAKIRPVSGGGFTFKAVGRCVDLAGIAKPVTVGLTIGNDGGSTDARAEIASSRQRRTCGDRRDDDEDDHKKDRDRKHDDDD